MAFEIRFSVLVHKRLSIEDQMIYNVRAGMDVRAYYFNYIITGVADLADHAVVSSHNKRTRVKRKAIIFRFKKRSKFFFKRKMTYENSLYTLIACLRPDSYEFT